MKEDLIEKKLLKLSKKAYKRNEIPVSALIVRNNKIIVSAYNKKNIKNNVLYHAEILCILKACKKLRRWNLNDCTMYVSLEPCDMCKEIIQESRIDKVFYILEKGSVTNKYKKTKYEQKFVFDEDSFDKLIKKFFRKIRK